MKHCICLTTLTCFVLTLAVTAQADEKIQSLLSKVPASANSVVIIDVEALMNTPMAKEKKWKENQEQNFIDRPMILPPEADKAIIASHLNPLDGMKADWEVAVMNLTESIPMRTIARTEGGYLDVINGLQSAWTPSGVYFVSLAEKTLGMMYPDNRQYVSHWAELATKNESATLAPYLMNAVNKAGPNAEMVMAINLQDMPKSHDVYAELVEMKEFVDKTDLADQVTEVIASIEGVTLSINIESGAEGSLEVNFGKEIAPLKGLEKKLLFHTLDQMGADLEDIHDWKLKTEYNSFTMSGPLSETGLRLLSSLMEVPTSKYVTERNKAESGEPDQEAIIKESKKYFSAIGTYVGDLQKTLKGMKANQAIYMDRYAKKIEALPILHIDTELLDFGSQVAVRLRNTARNHRAMKMSGGSRKAASSTRGSYDSRVTVAGSRSYGSSGWGSYNRSGNYYYSGPGSVSAQNNAFRANTAAANARASNINKQQTIKANAFRLDEFQNIDDGMAEMRRRLTLRYNTEFK